MKIRMAHLQEQGINFAIFDADAKNRTEAGRAELLADLTRRAQIEGLRVEKSALVFEEHGTIRFYGTPDLVRFLTKSWAPQWTHTIEV